MFSCSATFVGIYFSTVFRRLVYINMYTLCLLWDHNILREPQHTPGAYPRHPQRPKWKEFLHKLLVGGLGYVPGACWKILRNIWRGYYLWTWFLMVFARQLSLKFFFKEGILGDTMKRILLGSLQRNTWHYHPNFSGLVRESSKSSKMCFISSISEMIIFQEILLQKWYPKKIEDHKIKITGLHTR